MLIRYLTALCLATLAVSKIRHSFLDRLVAYHKKHFIEELSKLPSPLTVSVEKAPPGFVDSPRWDKESVLRLVMLVEVLDAKPARHAIRRALSPSRRFYLPVGKNSFDIFPSWGKESPNDFEYDMVSYDDQSPSPPPLDAPLTDDTVIYISNPVEAHLPASRVTVKLLREIMEERAVGLRAMPTTKPPTRSWKSKNSSTTAVTGNGTAEGASTASGSTAAGGSTAGNSSSANETGGNSSDPAAPSNATNQDSSPASPSPP